MILVDALHVPFQADELIKKHLRNDPNLLLKAARTGIVDVWEIVVDAVEVAGQDVLQKVSNFEANIGNPNPALLRQTSSLRRLSGVHMKHKRIGRLRVLCWKFSVAHVFRGLYCNATLALQLSC